MTFALQRRLTLQINVDTHGNQTPHKKKREATSN